MKRKTFLQTLGLGVVTLSAAKVTASEPEPPKLQLPFKRRKLDPFLELEGIPHVRVETPTFLDEEGHSRTVFTRKFDNLVSLRGTLKKASEVHRLYVYSIEISPFPIYEPVEFRQIQPYIVRYTVNSSPIKK